MTPTGWLDRPTLMGDVLFENGLRHTMNKAFEDIATLIADADLENAESRLAEISPDNDESQVEKLLLQGRLLERRDDWDSAIEVYQQALDVDADHSEAVFRLAYLLDLRGDDEEAMALYEECIKEPPGHVNAMMNLAILYEDHARYKEAYALVECIVDEHPNHLRARKLLRDLESSLTMFYDEDRERSLEEHDAIMDTPVTDFELSVRSRNCLKQMNINTLGDLLRITEQKLLAYKNFGETSLNEIKAMLSQKGLRLGQMLEEEQAPPLTSAVIAPVMQAGDPNLLNRSVVELELSVRSRKCLQRLGIASIGELTQRSEPELLAIKNFGQTSLVEIRRRLTELGLSLRDAGR